MTIETIIERLHERAKSERDALGVIQAEIAEPSFLEGGTALHFFSWSKDAFKTAARAKVFGRYAEVFMRLHEGRLTDVTMQDIVNEIGRAVHRAVVAPPQSTSPTSNLAEQYEAAAMAELLEFLRLGPGLI